MDNYIALGDSISISSYPSLDAGLGTREKIGAADLTGQSLQRVGYVSSIYNYACDGAVIRDVYDQIGLIPPTVRNNANIITLTAGGNDISFAGMEWRRDRKKSGFGESLTFIENRFDRLVEFILDKFPNSILVLNSLYDPTDGTGKLPDCGSWEAIAEWYSKGRRHLGDYIRITYGPEAGVQNPRILFCDLFKLFDGHGMKTANVNARWYYKDFMIEPGCNGAKYISSEWLDKIASFIVAQQKSQTRVSFSH